MKQWRNKGVRRPGPNQGFLRPRKKWCPFKKFFFRPFVWDFFKFFSLRPGPIPRLPPLLRHWHEAVSNVGRHK